MPATDLYSLGVTLLRLLSGREPTALPQQGLRFAFRQLVTCSPALQDWVEAMIEPDLHQRFRSAIQAKKVLLAQTQPPPTVPPNALPVTKPAAFHFVHDAVDLKVELYEQDLNFVPRLSSSRVLIDQVKQWISTSEADWTVDNHSSLFTLKFPAFSLLPSHRKALAAYLEQDFSHRVALLQTASTDLPQQKGSKKLFMQALGSRARKRKRIQTYLSFSWSAPVTLILGTADDSEKFSGPFLYAGTQDTSRLHFVSDHGMACVLSEHLVFSPHSVGLTWECQKITVEHQQQAHCYFVLIAVLDFGKYDQQRMQKYNAFVFANASELLMMARILYGIKLGQSGADALVSNQLIDVVLGRFVRSSFEWF